MSNKSNCTKKISEKMLLSIERKAKHCSKCGVYQNHEGFQLQSTSADGRRPDGKCCRGRAQHQRILEKELNKELEMGVQVTVGDCNSCDDLFKITINNTELCKRCR